jgi:hypothetical protein
MEKYEIEYHTELLLRYFILKTQNLSGYKSSSTLLSQFIDNETVKLVESNDFNLEKESVIFIKTFEFLHRVLGKDAFKKYNENKDRFDGAFLESSFEAIAPGVALNIDKIINMNESAFREKIVALYSQEEYIMKVARGIKAITRMRGLSEFSKKYFSL